MVDYCITSFKKEQEQRVLINYITTGIQFIGENIAHIGLQFGGEGKYLPKTYEEIMNPEDADERDAEEIVDDVLDKCGLLGG